jgi:hypothetical protein
MLLTIRRRSQVSLFLARVPCCMKTIKWMLSPTHKRTEGRAPVWGSEFTSKGAKLQGGSIRNRC